jgi:hypothetical protein
MRPLQSSPTTWDAISRVIQVKARLDTFSYRARKFLKRRRLEVSVALTAVVALASAGAVTLAQYRESSRRFADTAIS